MSEHRIRGLTAASNMRQGGNVLQQRDRRAQLGGERIEVVVLWCCGVVVLWCCGVVVLWCCGVVVLWCCGVVVLWCCGVVVLWCCGAVDGRMVSEVALRRRIRGRSDDRRNKLYYIYMICRMALAVPLSVPIPPKQWSSPH